MNKHKKIATKFEIEEVENRVEFFFLSGVINQIVGATPYHHGGSYGDNFLNSCQPPKTACGSSASYSSGTRFWGFGDW